MAKQDWIVVLDPALFPKPNNVVLGVQHIAARGADNARGYRYKAEAETEAKRHDGATVMRRCDFHYVVDTGATSACASKN
jgi:hypothetical protein